MWVCIIHGSAFYTAKCGTTDLRFPAYCATDARVTREAVMTVQPGTCPLVQDKAWTNILFYSFESHRAHPQTGLVEYHSFGSCCGLTAWSALKRTEMDVFLAPFML